MKLKLIRKFRRWWRDVRPTLKLALPIMSGMVSQMLLGLADTIMIGRVGVVPLAAASFVNSVTHIPLVFGMGLLSSVAVLGSQAFGARRNADAGEVLRHGLVLGVLAGLVTAIVMVLLRPHLARFGQPPEVVAAAGTYLILFGTSMLPALLAHAGKQFAEALNHAWIPNFILLAGVLLNILLNWILIYGNWGAPALGLEGAGWATLMARVAMALGLVAYVILAPELRRFQPVRWWASLHASQLQNLLRIGWPVALQHLLEVSAFVFAALMMGWISADALAAHQIALSCAATTFMFTLGLGMAVCIRVGQAWGEGKQARMRRIGFHGIGLAIGIMGVFALVLMTARTPIARLFVDSPEVIRLTANLLIIAALFQVADGVQVVAISALRGLNDVRVPALVAALAYWIVAVPVGYLLAFPARQGAPGIWIGLAFGLGTAAVILSRRFHRRTMTSEVRAPHSALSTPHSAL